MFWICTSILSFKFVCLYRNREPSVNYTSTFSTAWVQSVLNPTISIFSFCLFSFILSFTQPFIFSHTHSLSQLEMAPKYCQVAGGCGFTLIQFSPVKRTIIQECKKYNKWSNRERSTWSVKSPSSLASINKPLSTNSSKKKIPELQVKGRLSQV